MSPAQRQGLTRASALVVHGALVMGVIVIAVTLGAVRAVAAPPIDGQVWLFRLVAFTALIIALVLIRLVRLRIAPVATGGDDEAWWRRHSPLVLLLWMAAEGTAFLGAVLWFVSDDAVILIVVTTVSLALLIANRPSRLVSG